MAVGKALQDEECWITLILFNGLGVPAMLEYLEIGDRERFNINGNVLSAELDAMIQTWGGRRVFSVICDASVAASDGEEY